MYVIYPRCAACDVHKKTVVVTVLLTETDGTVKKLTRTFTTMTADLEEGRTIVLVNPQHMNAVPGRKTDVKDSEWLADLLRHGLLTASFIPPKPIRELRELTRYRKTLVQERT